MCISFPVNVVVFSLFQHAALSGNLLIQKNAVFTENATTNWTRQIDNRSQTNYTSTQPIRQYYYGSPRQFNKTLTENINNNTLKHQPNSNFTILLDNVTKPFSTNITQEIYKKNYTTFNERDEIGRVNISNESTTNTSLTNDTRELIQRQQYFLTNFTNNSSSENFSPLRSIENKTEETSSNTTLLDLQPKFDASEGNRTNILNKTIAKESKSEIKTDIGNIGVTVNFTKNSNVHFYQSKETNDDRAMFMVDPENKQSKITLKETDKHEKRTKHSNIISRSEKQPNLSTSYNKLNSSRKPSKERTKEENNLTSASKDNAVFKLKDLQGRVRQIKENIEKSRKVNNYLRNLLHQKDSEIIEVNPYNAGAHQKSNTRRKSKIRFHKNQMDLRSSNYATFPLVEDAMKRNKVQANRIYSVDDQPIHQQANKKNVLIQQAADELKSVLSKKTLSSKTKSKLLTQIFDDKGDNEKAKVATEIFRQALEPSTPTHGQVGDLGAEMIKVSVVARKKSHRSHKKAKASLKKKQAFPDRLAGNFRKNKLDLSEYIPEMEEDVTGDRKSKLKINASNFAWDDPQISKKKTSHAKSKLTLKEFGNSISSVEKSPNNTNSKHKNHSNLYTLLKKSANKINMKGRSAKLLSVKELGNMTKFKGNKSFKVPQSRKDLVIELDDDMNSGKDVRDIDPIMSLIRKFAKSNQDDDIAIIDERDYDIANSNDIDDGFISSNRRRLGENLFMESFAENESNALADSDEPSEETGVQRSFLPPEESFIDDNYESKLESYFPLAALENSYYQPSAVYDQVQDDSTMLSPQKANLRSLNSNDPEIFMEVDKRRRESIPDT